MRWLIVRWNYIFIIDHHILSHTTYHLNHLTINHLINHLINNLKIGWEETVNLGVRFAGERREERWDGGWWFPTIYHLIYHLPSHLTYHHLPIYHLIGTPLMCCLGGEGCFNATLTGSEMWWHGRLWDRCESLYFLPSHNQPPSSNQPSHNQPSHIINHLTISQSSYHLTSSTISSSFFRPWSHLHPIHVIWQVLSKCGSSAYTR